MKGQPNGFLCTTCDYGDFELEYEVWIDPKQNSGVQIRSEFPTLPKRVEWKGKTINVHTNVVVGYQVEIDGTYLPRAGDIYDEGRRGWLQSERAGIKRIFKVNDWNRFRVKCQGDHLQTWVNSVPVVDIHDGMVLGGFIGFQVHSSSMDGLAVKWRNVHFRELTKK